MGRAGVDKHASYVVLNSVRQRRFAACSVTVSNCCEGSITDCQKYRQMGGCCSKLREGDYFEQVLYAERDEREREQNLDKKSTKRIFENFEKF